MSSKGLSYDVARNMVEGWRIKAILSILTTFIHPLHSSDPTRRGCPAALGLQKKKMLRQAYQKGYGVWIRNESIVFCLWRDTKVCVWPRLFT